MVVTTILLLLIFGLPLILGIVVGLSEEPDGNWRPDAYFGAAVTLGSAELSRPLSSISHLPFTMVLLLLSPLLAGGIFIAARACTRGQRAENGEREEYAASHPPESHIRPELVDATGMPLRRP